MSNQPYLVTPGDIHPDRKLPIKQSMAIIFFCPLPKELENDSHVLSSKRYFIHSNPCLVRYCPYEINYGDRQIKFNILIISEVYGHTMTSTTLEELKFYDLQTVFGLGLVGSINARIEVGDIFEASEAILDLNSNLSTDYHASSQKLDLYGDPHFAFKGNFAIIADELKSVSVYTVNSLYQEQKSLMILASHTKPFVINMESGYFYKILKNLEMQGYYYGVVSDHLLEDQKSDSDWEDLGSKGLMTLFNKILNELPASWIYVEGYNICNDIYKFYMNNPICPSHNYEHISRLLDMVENISLKEYNTGMHEPLLVQYLVFLATALHDVDDAKFFPDNHNYENARMFLKETGLKDDEVALVIEMISCVSSSVNGDSVPEKAKKHEWFLFPRYVDRLDAIGLTGIHRCITYAINKGNPFYLNQTPRVKTEEELWKIATLERYQKYNGKSPSVIDHFYDKLLRLADFETDSEYIQSQKKESKQVMIKFVLEFGQGKIKTFSDGLSFVLN